MNPDEKLILEATCEKRCYGQLDLTWSLYWYDNPDTPEPFNLTTLNVIPSDKLRDMVTNPITEIGMAFKANSLVPGRKYVLQLIAKRPNGVFGELRETLLINTAPIDGKLKIKKKYFSMSRNIRLKLTVTDHTYVQNYGRFSSFDMFLNLQTRLKSKQWTVKARP